MGDLNTRVLDTLRSSEQPLDAADVCAALSDDTPLYRVFNTLLGLEQAGAVEIASTFTSGRRLYRATGKTADLPELTDAERIEYHRGVAERALAGQHEIARERDEARAEAKRLREALAECEEYFDNRADADCEGDPAEFVPNKEMRLLNIVRAARIKAGGGNV
ncbi:hypothetical protein [Bosea sp. BK604]|uniref:hypothetical protein n=1 Tax=Bosea sp. BK604 TaxID=2512180 RepID=UPI00104ADC4B|nr:hypothetical protein [Bosea sp. BK604]TCR64664.1 hypothetical protein EV560_106129 [Bosea sp. BK604]